MIVYMGMSTHTHTIDDDERRQIDKILLLP